ncbi:hypothetical protein TIFTF001_017982 [Ficus carica]|uniref:Uncharacterized protein n=1 Tax=Ficus carica TaxID=3494 RepID=A0AA88DJ49_FICCA|nr:hypothetical protein TIFTF001_017982 [Ficus carica]
MVSESGFEVEVGLGFGMGSSFGIVFQDVCWVSGQAIGRGLGRVLKLESGFWTEVGIGFRDGCRNHVSRRESGSGNETRVGLGFGTKVRIMFQDGGRGRVLGTGGGGGFRDRDYPTSTPDSHPKTQPSTPSRN